MTTSPQDRLKEQVSVSVKESLDRTSSILSNLHRVQSYLDILSNISSNPRTTYGLKNALDQIKNVRTDVASLLQTIYLAEIGVQSLQDMDKEDMTNSAPFTTGLASMLDVSGGDDGSNDRRLTHNHDGEEDVSEIVASLSSPPDVDFEPPEGLAPSSKRQKLAEVDGGVIGGGGIAITSCVACGKKFANQWLSSDQAFCRSCRLSPNKIAAATSGNHTPSGLQDGSSEAEDSFVTPRTTKTSSRGYLNRLRCTLCGASFLYRRCLHRHIRENHAVDHSNLEQYIQSSTETGSSSNTTTPDDVGATAVPCPLVNISSSMTQQQQSLQQLQDAPQNIPSSPHILLSVPTGDGYTVTSLSQDPLTDLKKNEDSSVLVDGPDNKDQAGNESLVRKFVCPTCQKTFDRQYRLQRHSQIHDPNRPRVNCPMCDKYFTRMDTLDNHIKCLHSEERPFKCNFAGCNKCFPLQSSLIHHHKVHMDGKPYKCNECESSFALLGEFRVHQTEVHASTKNLRCNECYKVFPSTSDLAQHVKDEHRLECEMCMRTFSRLAHLQSHIEIHKGDSLFNCRVCSAGFSSAHLYKKHVRVHSRSISKTQQSHPCTICEKTFGEVDLLMEHYRSEEHRVRVHDMGLDGTSILHTIEGGELSPEIRSLVDEVTGSIGASEVDKRLIEGLRVGEGGVAVMDGDTGSYTVQVSGAGLCQVGDEDRHIEC